MPTKVFIDGKIVDRQDATISVFDRGFLYGDSVYEVLRTSGGRPVDLAPHLERLSRSGDAVFITTPASDVIRRHLAAVLAAAGNEDSYIRIVVTRGSSEIGLDMGLAGTSSLIVIVKPLTLPPAELYHSGAELRIVGVQVTPKVAMDPSVKSGNYLSNIMALREAKQQGAHEALRLNKEGFVAEGASSNVFVSRKGKVVTPPKSAGLLPGITRMRIMQIAKSLNIEVTEQPLHPDDVRGADEIFITSSIRGLLPITKVDGSLVADGKVGTVTRALLEGYNNYLKLVATHD